MSICNVPPLKDIPWYESGLFWGCTSCAVAMLLAVLAAMLKDFRWLLIFVWPLLGVSWWVACRGLKSKVWRWILFSALFVGTGIGLRQLNSTLKPETASTSPNANDARPTAPPASERSAGPKPSAENHPVKDQVKAEVQPREANDRAAVPIQQPLKQRALSLANQLQIFYTDRADAYERENILLYPDTELAKRKREEFDRETIRQLNQQSKQNLDAVINDLRSKGLDTTAITELRRSIESQQSLDWGRHRPSQEFVLQISQELRDLARQIDNNGTLVR